MKNLDRQTLQYTLLFDPLQDNRSIITLANSETADKYTVEICIDDHSFKHRVQQEFPSVIADIIDLAVAIHASDRLSVQDPRQPQIQLQVCLPVRHPEILNQSSLQQQLCDLLEWVTGKKWSFEFKRRYQPGRLIEHEPLLWSSGPDVDEVALWSGGLDALAGLYARLKQSPSKSFALFGSGSNDNNYARQQHVFHGLQPLFPNRLDLCRAPIRFDKSSHHAKNSFSRARGIVFMLLGSAYAYLRGCKILQVYENGIGAVNLPYRKSAVGLDHSRSVHPETLCGVGLVMSEVIGEKFQVHNPFLFNTKTEMLRALAEDARSDLTALTSSCDSPHRKPQQPVQCGYCSSCILRKQALAASQLADKTHYVVPHGSPPAEDTRIYLANMLSQVSTLRERLKTSDQAVEQWKSLTQRFPELNDTVDRTHTEENLTSQEMQYQFVRLFQAYVFEWDEVEQSLLHHFEKQQSASLDDHESPLSDQKELLCP
jgi:7-cyano-7-deazaguanine synthase in queuosine biosynthesis